MSEEEMLKFIKYKVTLYYKGSVKTFGEWLMTPHFLLDDCTPSYCFLTGRTKEVYDIIRKATEHK